MTGGVGDELLPCSQAVGQGAGLLFPSYTPSSKMGTITRNRKEPLLNRIEVSNHMVPTGLGTLRRA